MSEQAIYAANEHSRNDVVTNTCCPGHLGFLFTNPPFRFLTLFCVFRPDYFKFPHQYFSKLNDSITESYYYTSSYRMMLQVFFLGKYKQVSITISASFDSLHCHSK